jgi:hypothetical protein
MKIEISHTTFYSNGDEQRLFQGFGEIGSIKSVTGCGRSLIIDMDLSRLTKSQMRELLALLWRYGISLKPFRFLGSKDRFSWLNEKSSYWYNSMYKN